MQNPINRIRTFYEETVQEVKKCTWPSRQELMESTILVIVAIILLTSFVGAVDFLSQMFIRFVINL